MPASIHNPEHWRERAAEARAVADGLADAEARKAMLKIAADYEKLAMRAEYRQRGAQMPDQRPAT